MTSRARDEQLDDVVVGGVAGHRAAGHPVADRLPVGAECHQAQEEVPHQGALVGRHLFVERLGRLGDGASDAAGGAVAVHGERASFAALPGGAQGVGQQREGARFVLDVLHQQLDQARFEQEPGLVRRSLDGGPQIGLAHGTHQVHARLDQAGEAEVGGQLTQPVGPQRDHQRAPLGVRGQGREQPGLLVGVVAQSDGLLALVDHQHRGRP